MLQEWRQAHYVVQHVPPHGIFTVGGEPHSSRASIKERTRSPANLSDMRAKTLGQAGLEQQRLQNIFSVLRSVSSTFEAPFIDISSLVAASINFRSLGE